MHAVRISTSKGKKTNQTTIFRIKPEPSLSEQWGSFIQGRVLCLIKKYVIKLEAAENHTKHAVFTNYNHHVFLPLHNKKSNPDTVYITPILFLPRKSINFRPHYQPRKLKKFQCFRLSFI